MTPLDVLRDPVLGVEPHRGVEVANDGVTGERIKDVTVSKDTLLDRHLHVVVRGVLARVRLRHICRIHNVVGYGGELKMTRFLYVFQKSRFRCNRL